MDMDGMTNMEHMTSTHGINLNFDHICFDWIDGLTNAQLIRTIDLMICKAAMRDIIGYTYWRDEEDPVVMWKLLDEYKKRFGCRHTFQFVADDDGE